MKRACSAVRGEPPAIFRSQEAGKINLNFQKSLLLQQKMIETAANSTFFTPVVTRRDHNSSKTSISKENSKKKPTQPIKPINIYQNKIDSEKFSEKFYICAAFHAEDACVMQNSQQMGALHHQCTAGHLGLQHSFCFITDNGS